VAGGYARQIPIDKALVLDASSSVDTDFASGIGQLNALTYEWSCKNLSVVSYGASCDGVLLNSKKPVANVPSGTLRSGVQYQFTIKCTSTDGTSRSNSKDVIVTGSPPKTPTVAIATTSTKFNPTSSLSITGTVTANISSTLSVVAYWAVDGIADLSSIAVSQFNRKFQGSAVQNGQSFSVVFLPNVFIAGITYTFTMFAYVDPGVQATSSASISLLVNGPPSGGSFNVTPSAGFSIGSPSETSFLFASPNWVDDPTDLPLTYEFRYYTVSFDQSSSVQQKSQTPSSFAKLPFGAAANNFQVFGYSNVRDALDALQVTGIVSVVSRLDSSVSSSDAVQNALNGSLSNALATSNPSLISSVVDSAVTMLNTVNCSLAPLALCDSLNREGCAHSPNLWCVQNRL